MCGIFWKLSSRYYFGIDAHAYGAVRSGPTVSAGATSVTVAKKRLLSERLSGLSTEINQTTPGNMRNCPLKDQSPKCDNCLRDQSGLTAGDLNHSAVDAKTCPILSSILALPSMVKWTGLSLVTRHLLVITLTTKNSIGTTSLHGQSIRLFLGWVPMQSELTASFRCMCEG